MNVRIPICAFDDKDIKKPGLSYRVLIILLIVIDIDKTVILLYYVGIELVLRITELKIHTRSANFPQLQALVDKIRAIVGL